jgi:hypothetical protein
MPKIIYYKSTTNESRKQRQVLSKVGNVPAGHRPDQSDWG